LSSKRHNTESVGFIVTNMTMTGEAGRCVLRSARHRGAARQESRQLEAARLR
jgi:hypothetical protein